MVEFRKYIPLPVSVAPLIDGIVPTKQNIAPGTLHVIARGAIKDGMCLVSLWDEKTGRYYQERMSVEKWKQIEREDGVEMVNAE